MNTAAPATVNTDETMPKKEFQGVQLQPIQHTGGMRLALTSFAELEKFSHFMALSNFMPKHLRGKQADCLAVLLQSMRWEMDPFAVAQKTYFVNDGMAYEAQLVNAIILARAPLKGRPKISWSGEGENLKCKVSAVFEGEEEPQEFEAEMKTISTRNSPLWKQQPKQQLAYFATRAWARIYCPDVLMGVYTKDEMEDSTMHYGADNALDITPQQASALQNIEAGIAAEKDQVTPPKPKVEGESLQVDTPHDPVTGEITEQVAQQNQDAAASPEPEAKPEFNINNYNLNTQTGTKEAVKALCVMLSAYPLEERPTLFVASGGMEIISVIGRHGLGREKTRFIDLGIVLPQAEAA